LNGCFAALASTHRKIVVGRAATAAEVKTGRRRRSTSAGPRCLGKSKSLMAAFRQASDRFLTATSGRSHIKKIVSPTTGSKVQLT